MKYFILGLKNWNKFKGTDGDNKYGAQSNAQPTYDMKRNTYYTLSFILVGLVLLGGRYLGYGFIERVISAFIVGGLFELVYRKKLK